MELDFTALNNIPLQRARRDFSEPLERSTALEQYDSRNVATHKLDREKADRENSRQMYAAYQTNIKRAGTLRSDILKGLKSGEDLAAILLKALECISLMTGDIMLFEQGKKDLLAVYGWGLNDKASLKMELEEVKQRLALLTRPGLITDQIPQDTQYRIQTAIKVHKELIDRLEKAIERAGNEQP